MFCKGVTFLARKALVTEERGPEVWAKYMARLEDVEPFFKRPVLPITQIPVPALLKALDLLVDTVYARSSDAWWHFGTTAGKNAVLTGQLKGLFKPGEGRKLLAFAPKVYSGMFDFGGLTVHDVPPDSVELRIVGCPLHPYFEGTAIGFAVGGLEALGAKHPMPQRIKGYATGDADIVFRFKAP